jgi:hypothetical protein
MAAPFPLGVDFSHRTDVAQSVHQAKAPSRNDDGPDRGTFGPTPKAAARGAVREPGLWSVGETIGRFNLGREAIEIGHVWLMSPDLEVL